MLLTPSSSLLNQWQEKQACLQQLQQVSASTITASTKKRDSLEQTYLSFVYQNSFDPLFGGLIVQKNDLYFKPIITNLYLSEILITAGHILCQGKLLYVGQSSLNNALDKLLVFSSFFEVSENYFSQTNLPCYLSSDEINQLLDEKERALFSALSFSNGSGTIVSYKCSLINAAKKIDMHYKEAQILEFGFREKLKTHRLNSNNGTTNKIASEGETRIEFKDRLITSLESVIKLLDMNRDQTTIQKAESILSWE